MITSPHLPLHKSRNLCAANCDVIITCLLSVFYLTRYIYLVCLPSTPMQIITQDEGGESDESDAVNILINTLHREGTAEMTDLDTIAKLRTGKCRVTFNEQSQVFPRQFDEGICVRRSLVIPNAPINKDHQTLLGIAATNISPLVLKHFSFVIRHVSHFHFRR